jgi:hypothetical protein
MCPWAAEAGRFTSCSGFNQQTAAAVHGVITKYAYRPDGLRLSRTTGIVTTTHIWDGANMAAEVAGSSIAARYIGG